MAKNLTVDEEEQALIEEREEEMVTFLGSKQPIKRKGWFLKPNSIPSKDSIFPPTSFTCSHYKTSKLPKCSFKGWVCSLRYWDNWVQKLTPKYKDLWVKVGIFDAITASMYKFGRDPSSLWGVARFWCEETNTFLFPWAEATITLEDVMILGGFPVTGEPVVLSGHVDGELVELESAMGREMRKFNQTKSKKADISTWMKYYIEQGNGDELEHIAFLAMWLSRFALLRPPARTIGYHVIPVAIRLARGTRIALGPAVLASIYRDLRKMKDYFGNKRMPETPPLIVWAPLHILQLWIWERFLALRPASLSFVEPGQPRAARWCNVGKKLNYRFVMSVIKSQDEIQWRPYLAGLDSWCQPSYFRDVGVWVSNSEDADDGLKSFAKCLRDCELAGLDFIEPYRPNRVARQFGLDQHIPHFVPRANVACEVYLQTYDVSVKNIKFYVPSKLFESDVTLQYSVWWNSVRRALRERMKGKKRKKIRTLQSCNEKEGNDRDDIRLSDWLAQKPQHVSSKHKCENPPVPSTDVTICQNNDACTTNAEVSGEMKLSAESSETTKEGVDGLGSAKFENDATACNQLDITDRVAVGCVEEISADGCVYDLQPTVKEEPEDNFKMEEAEESTVNEKFGKENFQMEEVEESTADEKENFKMKEVEESIVDEEFRKENIKMEESIVDEECRKENIKMEESIVDEKFGHELDIEKLKEEIALIHARVKILESRAEVHH